MSKLFAVGGKLSRRQTLIIEIGGLLFFLLVWFLLTFPMETRSIKFSSSAPPDTKYILEGPENYRSEFSGDDYISHLAPGTYKFTAELEGGAKIVDSISFPEDQTDLQSYKFNKDSLDLEVISSVDKDGIIRKGILPPPGAVFGAFRDLHFKDIETTNEKGEVVVETIVKDNSVIFETSYSLFLNILGYIEAIIISLLFGFLIGLVPFFRALMSRWVNAIRFVPLSAVTGLFIAWFGMESNMKIQFLSFGILVYLLPVVVQRIDELNKVYLQTAYTLGASKWQQVKSVYLPAVTSRLIDDIRVLTAISWTYIILAELLNQKGGIGGLIYLARRTGSLDQVFALLIVIVIIGIIQDRLFVLLDRKLFKFKYQSNIK